MQRYLLTFLILLFIASLCGCNVSDSSFSFEQQKAIDNSIKFISNSLFTSRERIDTDIVKLEHATDSTWKSVWNKDKKLDENIIDSTDWIITIGDTYSHDFAIIICDSNTLNVIGYIPIEE